MDLSCASFVFNFESGLCCRHEMTVNIAIEHFGLRSVSIGDGCFLLSGVNGFLILCYCPGNVSVQFFLLFFPFFLVTKS